MKPKTCRWCPRPASGILTAGSGATRIVVPHCDQHWDEAFDQAKGYPTRTWKYVPTNPTLF